MWKIINVTYILLGGLISPIILHGLGAESNPPSFGFVFSILIFSIGSGIFMCYFDNKTKNEKWINPSISISPFGENKTLQKLYIASLSFMSIGTFYMIIGGKLSRLEWMGSLPLLIGVGLFVSIAVCKYTYKDNIFSK